jgi:hypothetical protein
MRASARARACVCVCVCVCVFVCGDLSYSFDNIYQKVNDTYMNARTLFRVHVLREYSITLGSMSMSSVLYMAIGLMSPSA